LEGDQAVPPRHTAAEQVAAERERSPFGVSALIESNADTEKKRN
jgi:hypothetical protein